MNTLANAVSRYKYRQTPIVCCHSMWGHKSVFIQHLKPMSHLLAALVLPKLQLRMEQCFYLADLALCSEAGYEGCQLILALLDGCCTTCLAAPDTPHLCHCTHTLSRRQLKSRWRTTASLGLGLGGYGGLTMSGLVGGHGGLCQGEMSVTGGHGANTGILVHHREVLGRAKLQQGELVAVDHACRGGWGGGQESRSWLLPRSESV